MFRLYHHPIIPQARKVRLALAEKDVPFELVLEKPWDRRAEFLALSPSGDVPVLVESREEGAHAFCDSTAICEYLDETLPQHALLGGGATVRAEIRRLVSWFDHKFWTEVSLKLLGEKALKRLAGHGEPDSAAIRAGFANIHYHLDYIDWLSARRNWLAGDDFSLADITAGAHLSVIDYLGDVPWGEHADARDWYARLKSRPGFRPLLADHIAGLPPPRHYANLDF